MSTSIIPAGWRGPVEVEPISLQGAKRILKAEFTSAVGHAATAELLTGLFGLEVTHNRVSVSVRPGDEFVAFQLLRRPPEGIVLDLESLQEIGYELRLIKFAETEYIETAAQAKRVLRDALCEITGVMDSPEGAEERAECLQVLAGAIESLAYKAYYIIDQDETPDECALVESLKDEAQAILDAPRCDCGAEPCEFENCDSQAEGWICHSCCAEAYGACGVKCPECGERVVPTLPVDYADRRLRSSCGPETTGHCGACGARWD
jgi:hypothetical protein